MIETPKRSVTRFFIPLIDVLILLFAIFIMLPIVDEKNVITASTGDGRTEKIGADDIKALKDRNAELEAELAKLRRLNPVPEEVLKKLQRLENDPAALLVVETLQIDGGNGLLYYFDGTKRIQIQNKVDLEALAKQHSNAVRKKQMDEPPPGGGEYQLMYLIQYPQKANTAFPRANQVEQYRSWSRHVQQSKFIPVKTLFRFQKPQAITS